jgi:hypothetical protein
MAILGVGLFTPPIDAYINQGIACASCGKEFSQKRRPHDNLEQIYEAYPEFKGKRLCDSS